MALRDAYLVVLDHTPEPLQPVVRGAATAVRRVRRAIRRTVRRAVRVFSVGVRPVERVVLSTAMGRRLTADAQRAKFWAPVVSYWRRLRPVVRPFSGPFVLIDATSVASDDAVKMVPLAWKDSAVVITDDPDLAPLRRAGVLYEYVPRSVVEAGGLADDSRRTLHLQRAYNAATPVRIESLPR